MRRNRAVRHTIILLGALSFAMLATPNSMPAEQKRKGSINVALGIAKSNDNETGNFGLLKSIDWNLLSGWVSGGINFGIIKNEILAMGNVSLKIPLSRIEPFVTAGYGIIIERFSPASNYGGGIRFRLGKKIGIVAEYRKLHFKYKEKRDGTQSTVAVDFFGGGLFYFF